MFRTDIDGVRSAEVSRQVRAATLLVGTLGLIWVLTTWILKGTVDTVVLAGLAIVMVAVAMAILNNWRSGLYLFLIWLIFEDLPRKYLGNNMIVYFGKDVLAGVTYISLFLALRRGRAQSFRPTFLLPFGLFAGLGLIQVFNPNSPSILYGLLGLKLYFYYFPLMFVGYVLVRNEQDLTKFLFANLLVAGVVAVLGIIQAIIGIDFLNPSVMAPELRALGQLTRTAPISGERVPIPTSVFVSGGRFSWYLVLIWILAMGTVGYVMLRKGRGALYALLALALVTVGAMLSGARSAVVYIGGSALVMSAAFLWGAPWRWGQGHRLAKALRRVFIVGGLALFFMVQFFPKAIGVNWSFYSETLSPSSAKFELGTRSWDYPVKNLMLAFSYPQWPYGFGTGTASLGVKYISRMLGISELGLDVESGYGTLILEMGILGPILWLAWSITLLVGGWRVVRQLRETIFFPLGFAILWFAFVLLIGITYTTMAQYQNFVFNAYLWLLVGVLFRLPKLAAARASNAPVAHAPWTAARTRRPIFARIR